MAEIILEWINTQVELSKPITQIEKDFSNGYLLGELLYRFNQQPNFPRDFDDKEVKSAQIMNFTQIFPVFVNLGVKFNSGIAQKIIREERGVCLKLLYQLKMALEKVSVPALVKKTDEFTVSIPAQKIRPARKQYDDQAISFFEKQLRKTLEPEKSVLMRRNQYKFEEEKDRQAEMANRQKVDDDEYQKRLRDEKRRAELNKLQRNAGFMEEWQAKGVNDWKENQKKKKEREHKQLEFEFKMTRKVEMQVEKERTKTQKEINIQIQEFEEQIKKKKEDQVVVGKIGEQERPKERASLEYYSKIFKTKRVQTEKNKKERERRRRKMLVDKARMQAELESERREFDIIEKMRREARQEQELAYEVWRTSTCSTVITENRKLREARYQKRRELDQEVANVREEEALKFFIQEMERDKHFERVRAKHMDTFGLQGKRKDRTEICDQMMETILDISNEAFKHQQLKDVKEVDPRNWHEWMQLFTHTQPIIANSADAYTTPETNPQELSTAIQKLDEIEFSDYLLNKGQWKLQLVTDALPNIAELFAGGGSAAADPKAKKGGGAAEAVINPEENEIPLDKPLNYILGNAIQTLIQLNKPPREALKLPDIPWYLPLRLAIIGRHCSGKATQASMLERKYGIHAINPRILLLQAIEYSSRVIIDTEEIPPEGQVEEEKSEKSGKSGKVESKSKKDRELIELGQEIKGQIEIGKEVEDITLIKLILHKLGRLFPIKSPEEIEEERRTQAMKEIIKETAHEVSEREDPEEDQEHPDPEPERKEIPEIGYVLVDFPNSLNQAKLLERALTNFTAKRERAIEYHEEIQRTATEIVAPSPTEKPPKFLHESGLDLVIWLETPREECLRRAIGRKKDPKSDTYYHIEDSPPDTNKWDLVEGLQPVEDDFILESSIMDNCQSFDKSCRALNKWMRKFGSKEGAPLCRSLPADISREEINERAGLLIDKIVEGKKEIELGELQKVKNILEGEKKAYEEELKREEEEAEREGEEEEVPKVPAPKVPEVPAPEAPASTAAPAKPMSPTSPEVKSPEVKSPDSPEPPPTPQKEDPIIDEEVKDPHHNLDDDFKSVLLDIWLDTEKKYREKMQDKFQGIRSQRELIIKEFAERQRDFIEYLQRMDQKQGEINDFVKIYNEFLAANPDMIEENNTKEELHQRVDDLSDYLVEMIEGRKKGGTEERERIVKTEFIEEEMEKYVSLIKELMQAEIDRFSSTHQILVDYYFAIQEVPLVEVPDKLLTDLVEEGEELPPVEEEGNKETFPRLNKLFERAFRAQIMEEKATTGAVTAKKVTDKGKKDPKKGKGVVAGAAGASPDVDDELPENELMKEMKEGVDAEKAILRFRLTMLRNMAVNRLTEMRDMANSIYDKLEDWVEVANNCENNSVTQLSNIINAIIEQEHKVRFELKIDNLDLVQDKIHHNFLDPPPELFSAIELTKESRFSIRQIKNLIRVVKLQSDNNMIHKINLVELFKNLIGLGEMEPEEALPIEWQSFTLSQFQKMGDNMDKENTGFINSTILLTYICLLQSSLPKEKDTLHLVRKASHGQDISILTFEQFMKCEFWFDETEKSAQRDKAEIYNREKEIINILFELHKAQEETINLPQLVEDLKGNGYVDWNEEVLEEGKRYFDILFQ